MVFVSDIVVVLSQPQNYSLKGGGEGGVVCVVIVLMLLHIVPKHTF